MSQITFQYKATDISGTAARGSLRAADRSEAYRDIMSRGLRPISIVRKTSLGWKRKPKISLKDISHMTYQFAVLMEARIPIAEGLRSIAEQESNSCLGEVMLEVAEKIESGESITSAMAPHRELFGQVYLETLRAAEVSGNLTMVLGHLANMLDQQYEMHKNIRSALIYPICVISALMLAVAFLIIFVIPKFAAMFASRGVELPLLTRMLMGIGQGAQNYWFIIVPTLLGSVFVFRHMMKRNSMRVKVEKGLSRIPYLRDLLIGVGLSRFCHVFGLSLRSGLGLLDALEMAGASAGRPLLQADAMKMTQQVNQGGRLSDVLGDCRSIPAFPRRMLRAGEEAGELPKMCQIVARHYDREVAHLAKNISVVIEPIMIVGLAGIVLLIALAIFLPMWNMAVVLG
ncbi:MAG: type II secretion system F family protein [Phycisphaerales bacterium]